MSISFFIPGQFPGLNEYTQANRTNIHVGAKMKKFHTGRVEALCRQNGMIPVRRYPVVVHFRWYEPDERRDYDNITFAKKFILDGLVAARIIENDSRRYVVGGVDLVLVDKSNPGVEVEIVEHR